MTVKTATLIAEVKKSYIHGACTANSTGIYKELWEDLSDSFVRYIQKKSHDNVSDIDDLVNGIEEGIKKIVESDDYKENKEEKAYAYNLTFSVMNTDISFLKAFAYSYKEGK